MVIRTFIAVETSEAIRSKISKLIERLQKGSMFFPVRASWAKPENIHLTLKFLGKIEEEMVKKIADVMREIAKQTSSFRLSAEGLGVFPNERQPRVLWVGIKEGKRPLIELQSLLEKRLQSLGFEPEQRAFHPHLTLARFKSLKGTSALMNIVKDHQHLSKLGEWEVSEMILFRSDLHPDGAIYTPLEKVSFRKR